MRALTWRGWQCPSLAGVSPRTLALTIALGLVAGVFPVYGGPTLLCVVLAFFVRPHVPLLQVINLATSPLQIALAVPFDRVGSIVLPRTAPMRYGHGWQAAEALAGFTGRCVAGWFLVCVPLGICVYAVLASRLESAQWTSVRSCAGE